MRLIEILSEASHTGSHFIESRRGNVRIKIYFLGAHFLAYLYLLVGNTQFTDPETRLRLVVHFYIISTKCNEFFFIEGVTTYSIECLYIGRLLTLVLNPYI